jgi:hypothetical protein
MNIERTLFWFKDGDEQLTSFSNDFFGLGTLLNRLLNEKYDGKKIKFINLDFSTDKTYEFYPALPKRKSYFYGEYLRYYGVFDKEEFTSLNKIKQYNFVWENAHKYLIELANATKNSRLLNAADYAYLKGFEMDLNPDYRVVDTEIIIFGEHTRASVWINFKEDGMYSKFTLERYGNLIFERELDKTQNGVEFFLEMYKAIVVEGSNIVIKGRTDASGLPLKISLSEIKI